ncbi:hypothetical protein PHET_01535 [Paragonimus heterotremus]|uniref:Mic1 domain-containing protein n=1 Tax=Paragonimus heterotremus TaxID=100268 RepID=A0A8J4TDV6_9TREM|nr:hypothetical protein PHET_01535 [Paragonimus heterotremus]
MTMIDTTEKMYYLSLSEEMIIFEPVSSINSVFFDPANQQVFALRSRGAMGVNVKSPIHSEIFNFRIEDRGEVLSIKFSTDNSILAIQRTPNTVDFLSFINGAPDVAEYSQGCKSKTANLLGFIWCSPLEIVFVTTEHLELYQVLPAKRQVRLIKHTALLSNWFAWDPVSHILVASTAGSTGITCHTFHLKTPGLITKLSKFDLPEFPTVVGGSASSSMGAVLQNTCLLATIYDHVYFFFVHKTSPLIEDNESDDVPEASACQPSTVISLYRLKSDGSGKLTDELFVAADGQVAVSILDNLVLVHSQQDRKTSVYDIAVGGQSNNGTLQHYPLFSPSPIAPLTLASSAVPLLSSNLGAQFPVELYSCSWVLNLPNVVIDGRLGCLWTLRLNNGVVPKLTSNRNQITDFLLHRDGAKQVILDYCSSLSLKAVTEANLYEQLAPDDYTFHGDSLSALLDDFAYVFKRFGELLHRQLSNKRVVGLQTTSVGSSKKIVSSAEDSLVPPFQWPYTVQQSDVYNHVFLTVQGNENKHVRSFFYAVLVEYIRSLIEHEISVDHCLHELLISMVARLEQYAQLLYCIQSRLLADSKPIALQLLSLESVYPAAGQLALDMLKRLNFSNEEVVEVLLLKHKFMEALRFCLMRPHLFRSPDDLPKRILKLAVQSGDRLTFYNVYRFFYLKQESGLTAPCEEVTAKFKDMFA